MTMADPEPISVQIEQLPDGITLISLNRAHRRNAVNPSTASKLYNAFLAFDADESQKVCVFYGQHGTFCAGADLQEVAKAKHDFSSPIAEPVRIDKDTQAPMGPSRLRLNKPVIAAVSGYAVAGGLELSLLADIRVVEEDAIFGVFCRRWGVPLIDGGTVRLPSVVGLGRALDMILTGRAVDAQEAHAMGLANRVVPKGKALEKALEIARELVKFPQMCLRADRASAYYGAFEAKGFRDAMAAEFERGVGVVRAEGTEGAARFASGKGRHGSFKL